MELKNDIGLEIEYVESLGLYKMNFNEAKFVPILDKFFGGNYSQEIYEEICQALAADLIIETLYDSTKKIIEYFDGSKGAQKKYSKIYSEFYFDDKSKFKKHIYDSFSYYNEIISHPATANAHRLIPMPVLHWYMYSLNQVIEKRTRAGLIINKVIDRRLIPLFNLKNDGYQLSESSRDAKKKFISCLVKDETEQVNKSLNLLFFNKETNLIDVYGLAKKVVESESAIENIKGQKDSEMYNSIMKKVSNIFNQYVGMMNIPGLATRRILMDNDCFDISLFLDSEYLQQFIEVFDHQKILLEKFILDKFKKFYENTEEEIIRKFVLYEQLKCQDLYNIEYFTFDESTINNNTFKNYFKLAYEFTYNKKKEKKGMLEQQEQQEQQDSNAFIEVHGQLMINPDYSKIKRQIK